GGYASTRWNNYYASAALAGAWYRASTDRTLTVAGTDRLQAGFDPRSIGARLEGGYRFALGALPNSGITPYAPLQTQSLWLPGYSETAVFGSNQFALSYASRTATDTRSELGGWFDVRRPVDRALLTLRTRAAWVHDFNPGSGVTATFQTLPGASFVVNG